MADRLANPCVSVHRITALGVFALIALPVSLAQARPRDEVMSIVYRCNVISSDRQWLDCFYGAAQPVRAELKLQPATQAQIGLAASPPSGNLSGTAETRNATLIEAARCGTLSDDSQWLKCYYSSAQSIRVQLGLAPWPTVPASFPLPGSGPEFGVSSPVSDSEAPNRASEAAQGRIVAQFVSYKFDMRNIFTVTLANGQIWQQLPGDTTYARWNRPPADYTAVITHGVFGSTNLKVRGQAATYKVMRVR